VGLGIEKNYIEWFRNSRISLVPWVSGWEAIMTELDVNWFA